MADEQVLKVQIWLNDMYGDVEGFDHAPENGQTGWATIYSLREGLQHELNISPLGQGFGDETRKAVDGMVDKLVVGYKGNISNLIQGAFWCKGISPNDFSNDYSDDTISAVKELQTNAGVTADGKMTTNLMAALFDMSAFVLIDDGDEKVRGMQQWLNADYESYIGIRPCDGVYQRDTNEALIYALQAIEGMSTDEANGNYGDQTIALTPTVHESDNGAIVKLIQYGLYVNNYYQDGSFDGNFSTAVGSEIVAFRKFMILPDGSLSSSSTYSSTADLRVIKGLLTSNGDTNRDSDTFDCATQLTDSSMIERLYNAGFSIVGRYLTGSVGTGSAEKDKNLTLDEISKLTAVGFSIFPIYEDGGYEVEYFTEAQGTKDAHIAANAAHSLGFPEGTVIYFAADLDLQDGDIEGTVIAYLQAVRASLNDLGYVTGLYGTRNMCRHAAEGMGISNFFVANMSYGWSGNLGFPMPKNWCFDQFVEYTTSSGVDIDQDASSGRDKGVSKFDEDTGLTAVEAMEELIGGFIDNTDFEIGKEYSLDFDPIKITFKGSAEYANKDSKSTFKLSNTETPETLIKDWMVNEYGANELSQEYTLKGLHDIGISEKITNGNLEIKFEESASGEFEMSLIYYVYKTTKGTVKETLALEVKFEIKEIDVPGWPAEVVATVEEAAAPVAVALLFVGAAAAVATIPEDVAVSFIATLIAVITGVAAGEVK